MIDILAYVLITFFLFITSLAIMDIKARTEHTPHNRMSNHEQMLVDAFDVENNKDAESREIDINSIESKIASETEHIMAMEKTGDMPAEDEFKAESDDIQKSVQEVPEPKTQPVKEQPKEEDPKIDELEMLIDKFEKEVNRARESRVSGSEK